MGPAFPSQTLPLGYTRCPWTSPFPSLVSVSSSVKPSESERLWVAFLLSPGLMVVTHCPLTLTVGPGLSKVTQVSATQ